MSAGRCGLCGRPLGDPADPLSIDCGGDCWGCIDEIEHDGGCTDSTPKVDQEIAQGLREADGRAKSPVHPVA